MSAATAFCPSTIGAIARDNGYSMPDPVSVQLIRDAAGTSFPVHRNPSRAALRRLAATAGEGVLLGWLSRHDGEIYVWDAGRATHENLGWWFGVADWMPIQIRHGRHIGPGLDGLLFVKSSHEGLPQAVEGSKPLSDLVEHGLVIEAVELPAPRLIRRGGNYSSSVEHRSHPV